MRSRSFLQRRFVRPIGLLVASALAITIGVTGIGPASAAPWSGSVTIAASPTATDVNSPNSTITVTLSTPLVAGYSVSFFDAQGTRYLCASSGGVAVFTKAVAPATNQSATYRAYVAPTCGTTSAPPVSFTAMSATTASVTNQGWTGTIDSVTANPATTDANSPSTVLSVALSKPPAAPYSVSIFNSSGQQYLCQTSRSVSGGWTTPQITIPNASSTTFTAYVAQDCGTSSSPPTTDVRATKMLTVSNLGYTGSASISAAPTSTDANSRNTVVTTTLTKPARTPYWVSTFSSAGVRYLCSQGATQTSYSTPQITVPNKATLTFTTYVALSCGTTTTPPGPGDGIKATASVDVTSQGYTGAVTLTADPVSTDAWNRTTVLTASLTKPAAPPYFVSVFDDAGNRYLCETSSSQPGFLTPAISPPRDRPTTFTAYVATDCGTPTSPPTANVDSSSSLDVYDSGWDGDVDVDASSLEVDAQNPSTNISVTLSKTLVAPYVLSLYAPGQVQLACVTSGTTASAPSQVVPYAMSSTFVAYVATTCGSTGAPPIQDEISQWGGVTVANVGWDGQLTVQANGTGPSFDIDATLSKPLAGPYHLSIWDDEGATQLYCSSSGAVSGSVTVTPPVVGSRNYSVYVAQGCGSGSNPPDFDVKAHETASFGSGLLLGFGTGGISMVALKDRMAAFEAIHGRNALCLNIATADGHRPNSSVSTNGVSGAATCEAGGSFDAILAAMKLSGPASGTTITIVSLWLILQTALSGPPTADPAVNCPDHCPPPPPAIPGKVRTAPGRDAGPEGDYIDSIAETIIDNAVDPKPSEDTARVLARKCRQLTQWSGIAFSGEPCKTMPILFVGKEYGQYWEEQYNYEHAAEWWQYATPNVHIFAAQTGAPYPDGTHAPRVNPQWVRLEYRKAGPPAYKGWYLAKKWGSPCSLPAVPAAPAGAAACDEFPFRATVEANPATSSTRRVDALLNSVEGGSYGTFVSTCLSTETENPVTRGKAFLVIPMVYEPIPTTMICARRIP